MSSENPIPRVPDVTDPQPSTPLTEDFTTGTANDPACSGADGRVQLTVDGRSVTVDPGETLLDAIEAAGADVSALCHDDHSDEIAPRSECRTCVVETAAHGLVPACSFPVEEGMTVHTDSANATEVRDVNLDLVLSNHNLRCTTCGQNGRCELQDTAIQQEIEEPRYGVFDDRDAYEPIDDTSPFIQIDRNKCILCNRCVEACNDVQVEGVLRIEGSGEETRIAFQNESEAMAGSSCVSCGHCATVCPTGSITENGLADTATLPIPGFNQQNSIGEAIEYEPGESTDPDAPAEPTASTSLSGVAGVMDRARRQAETTVRDVAERAFLEGEHAAERVASSVLSEGQMFDIAEFVSKHRLDAVDVTETTCGYCSVGCRFDVYSKDDEVLGVRPTDAEHAPANDGFSTCVKGKFGYDFVNSDDRLEQPLIRENGVLREATWDAALERVATELSELTDEYGTDSIACFASSKCTNEENYLMQKFARQVLGTKNIDNCARLCHSSTVAALKQTVGYGAMTNRIEDVANTDCYLITGSNTTESHPVLATRIKQNVRDGADLIVFDPRKIGIAEHADQYTRVEPGHDVAWINGLIRYVIQHDLHDEAFIADNTHDFDELKRKVEPFTPDEVERLCGVDPADLASAAETIATADTCVFGWAMGMTQHAHGTQNVLALANLALVTGHLGKPNAGLSPFRGHNNVQGGGGDMGTLPSTLPGYQPLDDPAVLDAFEDVWDERPPAEVGLTVPEVFTEVHEGNVRGMYIMGENPALSEPDIGHAKDALEALEFLVVQDLFLTETAEHADVVLPAASFAEKSGTFTNTERRVQLVGQAVSPPDAARQDWSILQSLANRLGYEWSYESPAEIMDEISDLVPIYGGITHDRVAREGGLQWPCRDADDPGTPYLYEDGFNFEDGKARFVPADMGEPGELPGEEYPLTLTTGRVLYHFHTGTLTRRVNGIMSHVGESFVEIHPDTADQLGVSDGQNVRVESRRGSIVAAARVTDHADRGVVFMPMHFATGAVNELTQERFDPISGIPEYKISSVRISPDNA
ncbi:formate dehydrogenase subunit alpha [Natronorubrum thiooxidans]|nr:formate dehydrogenase subunit alpha [Natronorubrum thiooxidans]